MKTIKVSEATNIQLNWLVAEAELDLDRNEDCSRYIDHKGRVMWERGDLSWVFTPSTDWSQMGPIIDNIDGVLMKRWVESNREGKCQVEIHNYIGDWISFGPTLCVAAARCYVASKLGETVEVPEELT